MSYNLKCFRNGVPHERNYPGANCQQSMTRALKSSENWDYVETLSGNSRRYRHEDGTPKPAGFGTFAAAVEEAAQLRDRAQARLDAPKPAHKMQSEVPQVISTTEHGSRPMQQHRSPTSARNELRASIKTIAWYLPTEFRRQHLQQELKSRLGAEYTESNINNFFDECVKEGIFERVRFGWFSLRKGFAVPPPPPAPAAPVATAPSPPPAPRPTLTLPQPSPLQNPLDKLFDKPFQSKQAAPQAQESPPSNGAHPPLQIAPVVEAPSAPPLNVQNSMLSLMVLGELVAPDTTDDEMALLEISDAMSTMQKRLDDLAKVVAKYVKAQAARKQLLALIGSAGASIETTPKSVPATSDKTASEKAPAPH